MIGAKIQFDESQENSRSAQLLDELARVYARAAARAYFEKQRVQDEAQDRASGVSSANSK